MHSETLAKRLVGIESPIPEGDDIQADITVEGKRGDIYQVNVRFTNKNQIRGKIFILLGMKTGTEAMYLAPDTQGNTKVHVSLSSEYEPASLIRVRDPKPENKHERGWTEY